MQNRRDFLKTAAFAAIGSGLSLQGAFAGEKAPVSFAINQLGLGAKMKLRFFPYELKLKHVFTVATYSRTTTPDVQVEIEYDGVIGYGEASMPPYLGQTVDSVMGFLKKVDLEQFDRSVPAGRYTGLCRRSHSGRYGCQSCHRHCIARLGG